MSRGFDATELIALPRVGHIALAPDSTWVAVAVQRLNADRAAYVSDLWRLPSDGSKPVQLTRGEFNDSSPCFRSALPYLIELRGFFEPKEGDLHAFRFTRGADDKVSVALSTLFAHAGREDLQRMLAVECGLWIGEQAGATDVMKGTLAVCFLQRIVEGQGEWFSHLGQLVSLDLVKGEARDGITELHLGLLPRQLRRVSIQASYEHSRTIINANSFPRGAQHLALRLEAGWINLPDWKVRCFQS